MSTKKQLSQRERNVNDRQKNKKKLSNIQMQQAIIKKKQCDAKALAIVEQLLEPNVNPDWLLQNLQFINKSYMEDIIEERVITKLCGYVLCSKPLSTVIKQQYHISTSRNKVYDISRRKNFCSSLCYGASNHLLKQMLESPLWLREEDIPTFTILSINDYKQSTPGDEIDVIGTNLLQDLDSHDAHKKCIPSTTKTGKDILSNITSSEIKSDSYLSGDINVKNLKDIQLKRGSTNDKQSLHDTHLSELYTNEENKDYNFQECTNYKSNYDYNIQETIRKSEKLETQTVNQSENIQLDEHNKNIESKNININVICNNGSNNSTLQTKLNEISNKKDNNDKTSQLDGINNCHDDKIELNKVNSNQNTVTSKSTFVNKYKEKNINKINKKCKQKGIDNVEMQVNIYRELVMHIECNVRGWITKNTLDFLLSERDKKYQFLENLAQQDKYHQLCKKLNMSELQDKKEDCVSLEKNKLKPLPHLSVLEEEGKKMELKVRAFYGGQMTFTPFENINEETDSKSDDPILPLTDAHAPNALRRRIFLDKLSKILPNLLRALAANTDISFMMQYTYNYERYSMIKLLISTFNLSATNIVFKTAEWTLVGLIIIKMLSLIDEQLQLLLRSNQASMYISMILESYKLDFNYLDRLIMEITNNTSK